LQNLSPYFAFDATLSNSTLDLYFIDFNNNLSLLRLDKNTHMYNSTVNTQIQIAHQLTNSTCYTAFPFQVVANSNNTYVFVETSNVGSIVYLLNNYAYTNSIYLDRSVSYLKQISFVQDTLVGLFKTNSLSNGNSGYLKLSADLSSKSFLIDNLYNRYTGFYVLNNVLFGTKIVNLGNFLDFTLGLYEVNLANFYGTEIEQFPLEFIPSQFSWDGNTIKYFEKNDNGLAANLAEIPILEKHKYGPHQKTLNSFYWSSEHPGEITSFRNNDYSNDDLITLSCGAYYTENQQTGQHTLSGGRMGYFLDLVQNVDKGIPEVYEINKSGFNFSVQDIKKHRENYANPNYVVPADIAFWPALGNQFYQSGGYQTVPFVDINENQIYDPENGDFPSFPGEKCLVYLGTTNTNSVNTIDYQPNSTIIEYIYSFDCKEDDIYESTVFVKYYLATENKINYNTYIGFFEDFLFVENELLETNVDLGLVYSTPHPDSNFISNNQGTLVSGVMVLKGPKIELSTNDGLSLSPYCENCYGIEDGIMNNECLGMEYSRPWDSSPLLGLNAPIGQSFLANYVAINQLQTYPNSQLIAKYYQPSGFDTYNYGTNGLSPPYIWSFDNAEIGNGTGAVSTGPFNVEPFSHIEADFALIFGNIENETSLSLTKNNLFDRAKDVREAFQSNQTLCGYGFNMADETASTEYFETLIDDNILIYPNPTSGEITVQTQEVVENITLFTIDGTQVRQFLNQNNQMLTFSLSNLPQGVYILMIEEENGQSSRHKVIKR
jgi:hypothetical protein